MPRVVLNAKAKTPGLLPFLEEALERDIAVFGEEYEVIAVSESRKRSGYILKLETFQLFIWKSDPICEILLETLDLLVKANPSHVLLVEPSMDSVEGFNLIIDDVETRMWVKSKKLRILDAWSSQKLAENQSRSSTQKKSK